MFLSRPRKGSFRVSSSGFSTSRGKDEMALFFPVGLYYRMACYYVALNILCLAREVYWVTGVYDLLKMVCLLLCLMLEWQLSVLSILSASACREMTSSLSFFNLLRFKPKFPSVCQGPEILIHGNQCQLGL